MKYLFVHQNFPAQFLHLLRHLIAQKKHDIVFVGESNPNRMEGVRRVLYQMPAGFGQGTFPVVSEFEAAAIRAGAVANVCRETKKLGFVPDIIIGHHGWGELLNLADVWPDAPLLGYHEFFYHTDAFDVGFDPEFPTPLDSHPRIRAKNAVNLLALTNPGHGQTPTAFQLSSYPEWARPRISLLPEGVDTDKCRPLPAIRRRSFKLGELTVAPRERLVTYVSRDLEPYRGFHVLMRAMPRLLAGRRDVRVIMVGGDGVSYGARLANGTWREHMLRELGDRIDPARVHFVGKLPYDDYLPTAPALGRACVPDLPVRAVLVAAGEHWPAAARSSPATPRPCASSSGTGAKDLLVPFHAPDRSWRAGSSKMLEDRALAPTGSATNARRSSRRSRCGWTAISRRMSKLIEDVIERRVPSVEEDWALCSRNPGQSTAKPVLAGLWRLPRYSNFPRGPGLASYDRSSRIVRRDDPCRRAPPRARAIVPSHVGFVPVLDHLPRALDAPDPAVAAQRSLRASRTDELGRRSI